jgi:Domain of unknown function (DUF5069)
VNAEKLRAFALDLNQAAPRSPRTGLANFPAVAARLVDKCRAELVGWNGAYHYNCPMDRKFFAACGLDAEALREFIATGADDAEVAAWMTQNAAVPQKKITDWSGRFLANPLWRLLDLGDWLHVRASSRERSRVDYVRR